MKNFFRFHVGGIIVAISIGVVIAAPPIIFHFSKEYRGVEMMKTNTETLYVAFVQEVYDGHPLLGNPFLADLKSNLYLFPPLGANIIAAFGKSFFLTPVESVMVIRFFAAVGLTLLIYFFCFTLTRRRVVGLVAAPFVLLGYSLVDPHNLINFFRHGDSSAEKTFIDYGRPLTPQMSVLFFYGYLVSFWKFLTTPTKKIYGIISALLLGLSFYVYLFTWSFLFVLNGFLVIVYAYIKDWRKVKHIVVIFLSALLIGIPYVWHVYKVSQHPWYLEAATRFGFLPLHDPAFSQLVFGALLLFILGWRLFSLHTRCFFIAFFLTAIFVVNEQVLTGRFIFNHHYHWYYNTPLVIIFLTVLFFALQQKFFPSRKVSMGFCGVTLILFFTNGIMTQYVSYRSVKSYVIEEQRYAPLIGWLNRETVRDSVVLISDEEDLISSLTHNNVYHAGAALYTLIPDERILHSYLAYTYFDGISTSTIRDHLEAHRREISSTAFGYRYYFQKNVCVGCFPTSTIDAMVEEYQQLNTDNFLPYIRRYQVDYLVWDKKQHPTWDVETRFKFQKLQEWNDIVVYNLRVP